MRSDALARRIRIIEVACELFRSNADIVPLEVIAEKAGVGIATLYRNFPDRNALVHACAAYVLERVVEVQKTVLEEFDDAPQRVWYEYVHTLVDMGIAPLVSALAPDDFHQIPEYIVKIRATTSRLGAQIIAKAHQHGLVVKQVNHVMFIIGLITVARPPGPGVLAVEPDLLKTLVELYLSGLQHGPPPGMKEVWEQNQH